MTSTPTVLARAEWLPDDGEPPTLAGFIASSFSPLAAAVAGRCLTAAGRVPVPVQTGSDQDASAAGHAGAGTRDAAGGHDLMAGGTRTTGIVIVSASGDVATAASVATAVDGGTRLGPLLFFQSVPNAVAGHIAARWGLTGPIVCLSPAGDGPADGLSAAELLIADGDADDVLVVVIEQSYVDGTGDHASAVLVSMSEGVQP